MPLIIRVLFISVLLLVSIFQSRAQTDSSAKNTPIQVIPDSGRGKNINFSKRKDPRRASLLSAVFPGAGQFYNGKYWKIPILLGGGYALGYFINLNNEQYVLCRDAYLQIQNGQRDYFNGVYSAEQLVRLREYWRRNRDLLIILSAFSYLLNIADAAVDAHLSGFDVTDDISLKIQPDLQLVAGQPVGGIRCTFQIR